ncbi:MAG: hypothetical protein KJ630_01735 [Proteobacteria bacterium]|nr:hypothetical protein [Pseudomonadota bacterium]
MTTIGTRGTEITKETMVELKIMIAIEIKETIITTEAVTTKEGEKTIITTEAAITTKALACVSLHVKQETFARKLINIPRVKGMTTSRQEIPILCRNCVIVP